MDFSGARIGAGEEYGQCARRRAETKAAARCRGFAHMLRLFRDNEKVAVEELCHHQ